MVELFSGKIVGHVRKAFLSACLRYTNTIVPKKRVLLVQYYEYTVNTGPEFLGVRAPTL